VKLTGKSPKVSGQAVRDPAELAEPGLLLMLCRGYAAASTVTRRPMALSWAMWLRIRRSMSIRRVW
jgi:hypothetical protein